MADTPPKRRRRTTTVDPLADDSKAFSEPEPTEKADAPLRTPGSPQSALQKRLEALLVGFALPFAAAGDEHCATIFVQRGPIVAEAWANLAKESPAVKRVLENLLKGGAWGGAIAATLSIAIPVAAHHGAPMPDFVTPMVMGSNGGNPNAADSETPSAS